MARANRDHLITTGKSSPQYFLPGTVLDAAKKRIHWIFEEFDNEVAVSTSGGKDSTVLLELALEVARERGLSSIHARFLDQESEYQATVDYMRRLHARPEVDLDWYQIPFRLFNSTSHTEQWLHVWDERLGPDEWIRPKEPYSIHKNPFGKDRFKAVLKAMNEKGGGAVLTGMRAEESPSRRAFMTRHPFYKWVTWGSAPPPNVLKRRGNGPYLFHPIYDWTYRDVWKAIHDHGWDYNAFYDKMFQHGVSTLQMRVSAFHHEQSQGHLDHLQELEPETWERAVKRLGGVNTRKMVGSAMLDYYRTHLPYMFTSWAEYVNHLIDKLVETADEAEKFRKLWRYAEAELPYVPRETIAQYMAYIVMINDVYGSNLKIWVRAQTHPTSRRQWARWKLDPKNGFDPASEVGRSVRGA